MAGKSIGDKTSFNILDAIKKKKAKKAGDQAVKETKTSESAPVAVAKPKAKKRKNLFQIIKESVQKRKKAKKNAKNFIKNTFRK